MAKLKWGSLSSIEMLLIAEEKEGLASKFLSINPNPNRSDAQNVLSVRLSELCMLRKVYFMH
eukprot:601032-Amorphochlora_amoeboformis.AAC.1